MCRSRPPLRSQDPGSRSEDCNCDYGACDQVLQAWPLRGVVIHASAVKLSKIRRLTRGYRVGFFCCGPNNITLVPKLRLLFLRLSPNFPSFRTCGCFLVCPHVSLRLLPINLHTLRFFLCLSEVMLRSLIFLAFWIERSRMSRVFSSSQLQAA